MDNKHIIDLKKWVNGQVFQESNGLKSKRNNLLRHQLLNQLRKKRKYNKI